MTPPTVTVLPPVIVYARALGTRADGAGWALHAVNVEGGPAQDTGYQWQQHEIGLFGLVLIRRRLGLPTDYPVLLQLL